MNKLTAVLCTYNREMYVKQAIESILNQTYTDFDFIILDNLSTDNTKNIIESFNDKRINYIRNDTNIGAFGSGVKLLELVKTEYYIALHDDNIIDKELFQYEIDIMEKYQDVVVVSSNAKEMDDKGKITKNEMCNNYTSDKLFNKYEYVQEYLGTSFYILTPSAMYRTSVLNKYKIKLNAKTGPFNDAYVFIELNSLPENNKIYYLSKCLFYYRIHEGQDSQKDCVFETYVNLYKEIYKFIHEKNITYLMDSLKDKANYVFKDIFFNRKNVFTNITRVKFINDLNFVEYLDFSLISRLNLYNKFNNIEVQNEEYKNAINYYKNTINIDNDQYSDDTERNIYYWNYLLDKFNLGISNVIKEKGIKSAAIFGSKLNAYLIMKDLKKENIEVFCFIDNNANLLGEAILDKYIFSPYIINHIKDKIDAIIVSVEDKVVYDQIKEQLLKTDDDLKIIYWKDMVKESLEKIKN